jgi:GNAT superfamily N-acetyltransferase
MSGYTIRDGTLADLPALLQIRQSEALLEQYLLDAQTDLTRFLVCEEGQRLVGFAELVFKVRGRAGHALRLPRFNDLFVAPDARKRGVGTALIAALERAAAEQGATTLYCSVDPVTNHRALALYRRLGYTPLQPVPERRQEAFFDAWGEVQEHVYWRLELAKTLQR